MPSIPISLGQKTTAKIIALGALAMLACCATPPAPPPSAALTPEQAIVDAAASAPKPVPGEFVLTVKSAGRQDGNVYLDSEADYHDQRNLAVAICPAAIHDLATRYGGEPDAFFIGKTIAVSGAAYRVKITFLANGVPTEKYYYQTHVPVCSANQVSLR